jgi:hypothetical protein
MRMVVESIPTTSLRAEVDRRLAEAVRSHAWLSDLVSADVAPDVGSVDLNEAVDSIFAVLAGIAGAIDRLAAEIDAMNA